MKLQQEATAARKSLPLTARDLRDLHALTASPARRRALFALVDVDLPESQHVSEAQLLHAVWEAGLRAAAEHAEEESYAAESASRRSDDQVRRVSARRRRPEWAEQP